MIEPIYKYTIDQRLFNLLYCPTCKSKLKRTQLIDIFMQGLICSNNHHFFIEVQIPISTETAKCTSIKGSAERGNMEIVKSWLTNFRLRSKLNNQLAIMIRRIYEISKYKLNITYDYDIFKYCPFCIKPLEKFEQSDVWVQGLKCRDAHKFFVREGEGVGFSFEGAYVNLVEEMSDAILFGLLKNWLREKISSELKAQLHDQIISVMANFVQSHNP